MQCQYFGICGGCNHFTLDYNAQLQDKYERTLQEFTPLLQTQDTSQSVHIEVFASPQSGFRARSDLRFFRTDSTLNLAMMNTKETPHKIPIASCPILRPILQQLMTPLCELLSAKEILYSKIYACNLLCSFSNIAPPCNINIKGQGQGGFYKQESHNQEVIVTLIYHKFLDTSWEMEALELQNILTKTLNVPIHIIGRSKNQTLALGATSLCESLSLLNGAHHYVYLKQEGAFSQPNPFINISMLEFVASSLQNLYPCPTYDALELYCGSGNFTLVLGAYFQKVFATEVVKSAIIQLQTNMAHNGITNIYPVRLNALESIQALRKERIFFRLRELRLESFDFDCALIDPPRSGVGDAKILAFLQDFRTIIYISCNPLTLLQDLQILCTTHIIVRFGLFDQFPYTFHRECIVILQKKHKCA